MRLSLGWLLAIVCLLGVLNAIACAPVDLPRRSHAIFVEHSELDRSAWIASVFWAQHDYAIRIVDSLEESTIVLQFADPGPGYYGQALGVVGDCTATVAPGLDDETTALVATHEIGHCLGLDHQDAGIMAPGSGSASWTYEE